MINRERIHTSGGVFHSEAISAFHVSVLPDGFLPTREGKAILPNKAEDTLPLIAYLNSGVVRAFVRDTCGLHKQSGAIGRVPVPLWDAEICTALTKAARSGLSCCRNLRSR